ncbi:MAG: Rrf2 family transcriptional regulator [Ignavibacteriales bacterium]|nr:Rrf2 family transcriptional regulator [Ignavibacteriales bacterium]
MSYSLSFTKSILVVIFISDKVRRKEFEFLSTNMIADILSIPKPTLVKILTNLNAANIIETKEGKQGGIRLMKKPAEITVRDIFDAMEKGKLLFQTTFSILAEGKRPNNAQKIVKSLLDDAESQLKNELSKKTIEEILVEMSK